MKKFICVLFLSLFVCGCSAKLDENYDEATLKEKATEVIQYLNEGNYESITAMGDSKMSTPELADKLEEAWETSGKAFGTFQEIDSFDFVGKDGIATVIALANYQNNKVQFTISFNSNMELCGLYFK